PGPETNYHVHVAADNTHSPTGGRVYLSLAQENVVEAREGEERRVDFSAVAPYIEDSRLTGTPTGPFGEVAEITGEPTDGDIYVVAAVEQVVDRSERSGGFVRAIDGGNAPGTFRPEGIAVDPTNGDVLIPIRQEFGQGLYLDEFDSSGNFIGQIPAGSYG